MNRIRICPLWCDERSGALIGAGGAQRSDWPERVCEKQSIARNSLASVDANQIMWLHETLDSPNIDYTLINANDPPIQW